MLHAIIRILKNHNLASAQKVHCKINYKEKSYCGCVHNMDVRYIKNVNIPLLTTPKISTHDLKLFLRSENIAILAELTKPLHINGVELHKLQKGLEFGPELDIIRFRAFRVQKLSSTPSIKARRRLVSENAMRSLCRTVLTVSPETFSQ
jgi:hypothetical protein